VIPAITFVIGLSSLGRPQHQSGPMRPSIHIGAGVRPVLDVRLDDLG